METRYDLPNLLMMFDEGMMKIIQHLESGYADRALIRAKETHKALQKLMAHCVGEVHCGVEKKI